MAVNWPGLLAWSTKYHDGTAPSQFKQMTPEDRAFLERAMEEAFGHIEDPNKVFAEAIGQIKAADRTDESITTALEVIDRCCDDPDVARNAEKLDGVQPLLDLLGSHAGPLRVRTLEILALLFANNPGMQAVGEKRGAMALILQIVRAKPSDDEQSKAFRALVALVRNVQAMEERLIQEEDGISLLEGCLAVEADASLRAKAANFANSLAVNGRLDAANAGRLGRSVGTLFATSAGEGLQYRETLANCAAELAKILKAVAPDGDALATCESLRAAVKGRFAELLAEKDPDTEPEQESLKECLKTLSD